MTRRVDCLDLLIYYRLFNGYRFADHVSAMTRRRFDLRLERLRINDRRCTILTLALIRQLRIRLEILPSSRLLLREDAMIIINEDAPRL